MSSDSDPPLPRSHALRGSDGVWLLPPSMTAEEIEAIFCVDGVCELPPPELKVRPTARDWQPLDDSHRFSGVCTHWNAERGYGFIAVVHADANAAMRQYERCGVVAKDLFVHRSDVLSGDRSLRVGERLEYKIRQHRVNGKLKASEVRRTAELSSEDFDAIIEDLFGNDGFAA